MDPDRPDARRDVWAAAEDSSRLNRRNRTDRRLAVYAAIIGLVVSVLGVIVSLVSDSPRRAPVVILFAVMGVASAVLLVLHRRALRRHDEPER